MIIPLTLIYLLANYKPQVVRWPEQCVSTLLACDDINPNCNKISCIKYVEINWIKK